MKAEFQPGMGDDAYNAMTAVLQHQRNPSGFQNGNGQHTGQPHQGSSFQFGW